MRVRTLVVVAVIGLMASLHLSSPVGAWAVGGAFGSLQDDAAVFCARAETLCVDDSPGPGQEFTAIQSAVDRAAPGDTVMVFDGEYDGFRVRRGGTSAAPLRIIAAGAAVIVSGDEPVDGEDSIYIANASYLVLEGFVVQRGGRDGYGIGAHDALPTAPMRGVVIRNNVVRDAGSTNIYLSQLADSIVEGNVASGSLDSHGIYLSNAGSDGTVVRGNNCYDNAVNGIHFNGDLADTGDGLQSNLLVEGNILHRNDANGLNMDGVQDSVVRNNLVFHNGRHGLRAYAIDAAAGPVRLTIVNNTFVGNGGWAVKLTEDGGHHVVFNNILLSNQGSLAVDNRRLASDRNLTQGDFSLDGEHHVLSLRQWQEAGYGDASRQVLPAALFVGPEVNDYRLLADSPAVDFGRFMLEDQIAPKTDLVGKKRPIGNGYDAGALEYGDQ